MSTITISLPDGSERELDAPATPLDLAAVDRLRAEEGGRRRDGRRRGVRSHHRAPRRRRRVDHHERHRRRPPRPAPLDVARDGASRHAIVPGRQVLDRPGHRERLLLRLRTARRQHVQRRRPRAAIEARMREIMQGRTSRSRARRCRWPRRRSCSPTRPTRSRSSRRSEAAGRRRARTAAEVSADGVISVYRNTDDFVDMCVGPHVPVDRPARTFQAAEGGRRVLARQREGPDAAAHLRHGLGVQAGPGRPPPPVGGGRQARPSQAGDRTRPAQLPVDARWWPRGVAPEGRHRPQADRGLQPPAPRAGRLLVRLHAAPGQRRSCSRRPGTSASTPTACTRRWRWTTARTTRSR